MAGTVYAIWDRATKGFVGGEPPQLFASSADATAHVARLPKKRTDKGTVYDVVGPLTTS